MEYSRRVYERTIELKAIEDGVQDAEFIHNQGKRQGTVSSESQSYDIEIGAERR